MIATHTVKVNGFFYRAGEEIPSSAPNKEPEIVSEKKGYTKSDITLMKVAQLREVAVENGVNNPEDLTGTELKEILIEKLGL